MLSYSHPIWKSPSYTHTHLILPSTTLELLVVPLQVNTVPNVLGFFFQHDPIVYFLKDIPPYSTVEESQLLIGHRRSNSPGGALFCVPV